MLSPHSSNRWLSVRQSVVAQNIANANTPGYKAIDVEPFEAALESTRASRWSGRVPIISRLGRRRPPTPGRWSKRRLGDRALGQQRQLSSSSCLKAGEIGGAYARNTSVIKAFHRMLMASSRG